MKNKMMTEQNLSERDKKIVAIRTVANINSNTHGSYTLSNLNQMASTTGSKLMVASRIISPVERDSNTKRKERIKLQKL